jgi:hypothetical protein
MASSTSSAGVGSPLQWTDSSIALWATVPRAVGTDHSNPAASSASMRTSQPWTEPSLCFETNIGISGSRS